MIGIDFNLPLIFDQSTFTDLLKGLVNARRTDNLLTTDRLPSQKTIRQLRPQIPRQPSNKNFLLFRSIPLYGFCSDNLSSEPSGHRNLSSSNAAETLSLRHSRKRLPNHVGQGKRKSKLEDLRRLCSHPDKQSPNALRRRRLWRSTESRSLCFRFDNHRFVSITVSMGKKQFRLPPVLTKNVWQNENAQFHNQLIRQADLRIIDVRQGKKELL